MVKMRIDRTYERAKMKTVKIVYWQENDGMWLGHLEAYPDYMTQGETLDELKGNLKDILGDLESKDISLVRTHEDMAIRGCSPINSTTVRAPGSLHRL
jgi:hypothetical protein